MSTLLFIHGFATGPTVWQEQMDLFSRDHLVVSHSDHVLAHDNVFIIAWSMGVFKALKLYQDFPQKVKGLILVSAFPQYLRAADFPAGIPTAWLNRLESKFKQDYKQGLAYFYNLVFKDKTWHKLIETLPVPAQEDIDKWLEKLKQEDWREFLARVQVPVLLIHGEQDTVCLPASSKYMAEKLPQAKLELLPGVGHVPFLEQPEKFHQLVREFINANQ